MWKPAAQRLECKSHSLQVCAIYRLCNVRSKPHESGSACALTIKLSPSGESCLPFFCLFRHIFTPLLVLFTQGSPAKRNKNMTKNPEKINFSASRDTFKLCFVKSSVQQHLSICGLVLVAKKPSVN